VLLLALTQVLVDEGLGVRGTDLFVGHKPSRPHALTVLFEYGLEPPPAVMGDGSGVAVELSGVQVFGRGATQDYPEVNDRVRAVRKVLLAAGDRVVTEGDRSVRILRVEPGGGILPLGRDDNDCPEITANLRCWWEEA